MDESLRAVPLSSTRRDRIRLRVRVPESFRSRRRLLSAVAAGLAVTAAEAGIVTTAQADVVNLNPCNGETLSQPFDPWADPAWYELSPGGDFETPGWSPTGGAQTVSESEPYDATGAMGANALSLPAGSSATSPSTCVDAAYPTIRFFIRGWGAVAAGVVYNGTYIPAGVAVASGAWQPTPLMLTASAVGGALSGGTAQVSLRITALMGDPQIDDVFIDPWNRG